VRAWAVAGIAFVALLAGGLLFAARWAMDSSAVVERAAGWATAQLPGLAFEEFRGSLASGIAATRVVYENDALRVELTNPRAEWSPTYVLDIMRWAIASRARGKPPLRLSSLAADRLEIVQKEPSAEPARVPDSLELPLTVDVSDLRVAEIRVSLPDRSIAVRDLHGRVRSDGSTHEAVVSSLVHELGRAQGRVQLGARAPFTLDGEATVRLATGELGVDLVTGLAGTLEKPRLAGSLRAVRGGAADQGRFDLELTPFAALPLARTRLETRGLNLAQWNPDWPRTDLDLDVDATMAGERALAGTLVATNRAAGPFGDSRIPVSALRGRFTATPESFVLESAEARSTGGSRLRGSAAVRGGRGQIRLDTDGLLISEIDRRAKPLRVAGNVTLTLETGLLRLAGDLREGGYALTVDVTKRGQRVQVASAALRSPFGSATVAGEFDLDGGKPFRASGTFAGFNPADFGDYPVARLNGRFAAAGALEPAPAAEIELDLAESALRGRPLRGNARFALSGQRRFVGSADVVYAGNRATVSGQLGAPGDRLEWQVDAPALGALDPRLAGALAARGTAVGTFDAPAIEFVAEGRGLAVKAPQLAVRAGRLDATGRVQIAPGGEFALDGRVAEVIYDGTRIASAEVRSSGTVDAHVLAGQAVIEGSRLAFAGRGAWRGDEGWAGTVERFEADAPVALRLREPAALALGRGRVRLGPAAIDAAGGRFEVESASWEDGELTTRGAFRAVPSRTFVDAAGAKDALDSTVLLGGRWDVRIGREVRGRVEVERESGDVVLGDAPSLALGLTHLRLVAVAEGGGVIDTTLTLTADRIGVAGGTVRTRLARDGDRWRFGSDAPLEGLLVGEIADLRWLRPLLPEEFRLRGRATVDVRVGGTIGEPRLLGTVAGEDLTVRARDLGLELRGGRLLARFGEGDLVLERFSAKGPSGEVSGSGRLVQKGRGLAGALELKADALAVVSRSDRTIVVTGRASVDVSPDGVGITGRFVADRGRIELPAADRPALGSDVVVRGKEAVARQAAKSPLAALDVEFDFGTDFRVSGRGLDTALEGAIRFTQVNRELRATGTVRTVAGTYLAYGRKLDIERGILRFAGAVDNPTVEILALRKNQEVEAGVLVTGSVLNPRVTLASRPNVPDPEKLSWLLLGHGMDRSNAAQAAILQSATLAMMDSTGVGRPGARIQQLFELDQLSVGAGDDLQSGVLSIGKRLTQDLYVALEQGFSSAGSFISVSLLFGRSWVLRARTDVDGGAIDFFYTWRFD
jgi:translocation and assembly module TamB